MPSCHMCASSTSPKECCHCIPRETTCPCGGSLEPRIAWNKGHLYGSHRRMEVTVYKRECKACGFVVHYDGLDDGVYNYSDVTLFAEEVVRDFWNQFFDQKAWSIHGYFKFVRRNHEFSGNMDFCSRSTFTSALQCFLNLLDMCTDPAFQCPVCRHLPDSRKAVFLDGICMGMQKSRRLPAVTLPTEGDVQAL